jgi:hypothetical protein
LSNKRVEWAYLLVQAGFEEHPSQQTPLAADRRPDPEKTDAAAIALRKAESTLSFTSSAQSARALPGAREGDEKETGPA